MEVEALPDELLFHIFSLLTPTCLRSASLVSHQWHQVAKDNCVWKSMCEKAKLTMNSANRRKFENDWRAWYQAMQEGSFDILETDAYSSGIEV